MNTIKLTLHRLAIATIAIALTFGATVTATGCAAILPAIPKIVSVITDAMSILQIIDGAANEFFRTHPDVPPEVRAKYVTLHAKAVSALNGANHSLRGVEDLDQGDVDAAFAEFKAAYRELADFLASEGIMSGGTMKAGDGSTIAIPEPEALTFTLDE